MRDYTQLTCDVDNGPSVPESSVVGSQRFLLEHVFDLFARAQPTSSIIDLVDRVEVFDTQLVRSRSFSEASGCVDRIVYSTEARDATFEKVSDLVGVRYVCLYHFDFCLGRCLDDKLVGFCKAVAGDI